MFFFAVAGGMGALHLVIMACVALDVVNGLNPIACLTGWISRSCCLGEYTSVMMFWSFCETGLRDKMTRDLWGVCVVFVFHGGGIGFRRSSIRATSALSWSSSMTVTDGWSWKTLGNWWSGWKPLFVH